MVALILILKVTLLLAVVFRHLLPSPELFPTTCRTKAFIKIMRKIFSLFAAVLCAGSMLAGTVNVTFPMTGQTKVSSYSSSFTGQDVNGQTWTFSGFNNNNNGWAYIKCSSKNAVTTAVISTPLMAAKVNAFVLTVDKTSGIDSAKIEVLQSDSTVLASDSVTLKQGTDSFVVSGVSNAFYRLTIYNKKTGSNGATQISAIKLITEATDPAISCQEVKFGNAVSGTSQNVAITGENLTDSIEAVMLNGSHFTLNVGKVSKDGGNVTITVHATEEGEYTDTLMLASGTAFKHIAVTATVIQLTGDGTEGNPYTPADVIKLNNPGYTDVWVKGTIIGVYANNKPQKDSVNVNSNLALATGADTIPVALPNNDIRTALNLVDHPENLGYVVSVKGDLLAYFLTTGVKNVDSYLWETVPTAVENVAVEPKARKFYRNGQVYILHNGKVYDAFGSLMK